MNECKIVAVLNRKGGVCKTTTTHNLGVALVQRGYRVLLVDCDTQRNLSISLGLNRPDEECYTLCELLQPLIDVEVDEVDIQNCIHHLENGVDFIPNKQALSTVEKQISTLGFAPQPHKKSGSHKRKAIITPLQPAEKEAQKRPQSPGQVHQDQSHPNDAEGRLLQMCGNAA